MNRCISMIAITISIIGTYIIWRDSQTSISSLGDLLMEVTSTIGYWQDNPVDKVKIEEFQHSIKTASRLDLTGFILLIVGFGLQIFTLFEIPGVKKWFKMK